MPKVSLAPRKPPAVIAKRCLGNGRVGVTRSRELVWIGHD